jgi:hypothetical protein
MKSEINPEVPTVQCQQIVPVSSTLCDNHVLMQCQCLGALNKVYAVDVTIRS